MPDSTWRTAVLGPGGVGGLVGGVLTRAGRPVVYVAKPDTAATLNAGGLSVRSAQYGEFHVPAPAVSLLAEPVDLCLVTVKATAVTAALAAVPARMLGGGLVLPLLNGVEHMAALREHFPAEQVVAGAIRVESTRVAAGRIEHASPFSWIEIASDTAPPDQVEALATHLRGAGLDVTVRPGEAALLWDKLAFLAPLALLTTQAGAPIGVIRERHRADLEAVIAEVVATARANGAQIDEATVLAMFDRAPEGLKSSMQRDSEAGRPTELDAIGGAVLRAARERGVEAPLTARLVDELQARD